jgi:hypothetical protein
MQKSMEEIEAGVKVVKDELLDRLHRLKIDGTKTKDGYFVKKNMRCSFPDVTMSQAEELGAIKKSIDTLKLSALMKKGVAIKHSITQYITIKDATAK